jgi:hypothetical protein
MEPVDRNTRLAFRGGVRCPCSHLPAEHQRPKTACGVGDCDCDCRWYRPERGDGGLQSWSSLGP